MAFFVHQAIDRLDQEHSFVLNYIRQAGSFSFNVELN